jgi:polysaccharide pyruvyl transferase WcaK-like protein
LNFDTRASGPAPLALLRAFEGCVVGSNASSERDFRALFAQTDRIVTNSYHTAFWGLASGRAVGMIGFSSKYDSIRSMFGLDADYQRYRKGDDAGLGNAIRQVLQSDRFVRVPDAAEVKEKFRKLNFDVAERLVERGIFEAIAFVPDNELSLQRRADEVLSDYVLEEF